MSNDIKDITKTPSHLLSLPDHEDVLPLARASIMGNTSMIKKLLNHGADINQGHGEFGHTALHLAVLNNQPDAAMFLIKHGANIDKKTAKGSAKAINFIDGTDVLKDSGKKLLKTLLKHYQDNPEKLEEAINIDHEAMSIAITKSHPHILKKLLDAGGNVNSHNGNGWSLLHQAIQISARHGHREDSHPLKTGSEQIVKMLIDKGADVNKQSNTQKSAPLHIASTYDAPHHIHELLLKSGANPNLKDCTGSPAWSSYSVNTELLKLYNAHGAEGIHPRWLTNPNKNINESVKEPHHLITMKDGLGRLPIDLAVTDDHPNMVKKLIKHGAEVTPDHMYAAKSDTMVGLLKKHGLDINTHVYSSNATPLQVALGRNDMPHIEALLKHGADPNIKHPKNIWNHPVKSAAGYGFGLGGVNSDKWKDTVQGKILTKASTENLEKYKDNIIENMTSNNRYDDLAHTINHMAKRGIKFNNKNAKDVIYNSRWETTHSPKIMETMVKHGLDKDETDNYGVSVLGHALAMRHKDIAHVLVKHGAKINSFDHEVMQRLGWDHNNLGEQEKLSEAITDEDIYNGIYIASNTHTINHLVNKIKEPKHLLDKENHNLLFNTYLTPETMKSLISKGLNVNHIGKHGETPLHFHAAWGNEDTVKTLLDHGANPHAKDTSGRTPHQMGKQLSSSFFDPENPKNKLLKDAMKTAKKIKPKRQTLKESTEEHPLKQIRNLGYSVSIDNPARRDNDGKEWLAKKQEYAMEKYNPEDPGFSSKGLNGSTTGVIRDLHLPTDMLSNLKGVNNEHEFRDGQVHFHAAGSKRKFDDIKHSFEAGEKQEWPVDIRVNHLGDAYISEGNHRVAVSKAMGRPTVYANITYHNGGEDVDGPMHPSKILKVIGKPITESKVDYVNDIKSTEDNIDETPLMIAARSGHLHIVKKLLKLGADPNHVSYYSYRHSDRHITQNSHTALTYAIAHRHNDIARELLKVVKNVPDYRQGKTIMFGGGNLIHHAVQHNNYEIIPDLVKAGVDINHINFKGDTPKDLYIGKGYVDNYMSNALDSHGAKRTIGPSTNRNLI